jgi:hypothetical protein
VAEPGEPDLCFDSPPWLTELGLDAANATEVAIQGQGVYRFETAAREEEALQLCLVRGIAEFLQDLSLRRITTRVTLVESAGERRERLKRFQGEQGFSLSQA